MKIAIDARWIFNEISGIGVYTTNLIRILLQLDRENEYLLLFDDPIRRDAVCGFLNLLRRNDIANAVLPYSLFSVKNQILLPLFLKKNHIDLYHSTNYMIPLFFKKSRIVVTIHDIIPLKYPHFTPKAKKTKLFGLYRWIMKRVVHISDAVIVDSLNSKKDIIDYFSCNEKKVYRIYPGIDRDFLTKDTNENTINFKELYSVKGEMILAVGRQDPYKNIVSLVKAFYKLRQETYTNCSLILVGSDDKRYTDAIELVKELEIQKNVTFTGYLSKRDLISLYKQSDLLVLPSRYEGFGLPLIEAFASGLPVIASNSSSIPEVVGDAGLLVDPDDIDGFTNAMKKIFSDHEFSASLIGKGYQRLSYFSWEKAGEELIDIYKNVAQKRVICDNESLSTLKRKQDV
ncbi:glycosyltransferase family 4 protein [Chlamydiota bacterium]